MSGTTLDKNDGGPAFPHLHESSQRINETEMHGGMTLRDYFAAKAMAAIWSGSAMTVIQNVADEAGVSVERYIAAAAYLQADAMLKERSK
jgi:hypothetical protein